MYMLRCVLWCVCTYTTLSYVQQEFMSMLGREWTGVTVIEAKLKKVLLKAEAAGTRYIPL
jgi:hypothetical protein